MFANKKKVREIWQRKERKGLGASMSGGCRCSCKFRGRSCKMGGGADTLRRRAVKNREVLLNLGNFVKKIV